MDELRRASIAHYNASSWEDKQLARKIFDLMDADGSGSVSVAEFCNFVSKMGFTGFNEKSFALIDRDKNGSLDFEEAVLFYYIITTRAWCDMCGDLILDMYYSCVKCFRQTNNSYDLCTSCHSRGTFNHEHNVFVDNYALLRQLKPSFSTSENDGSGVDVGPVATRSGVNVGRVAKGLTKGRVAKGLGNAAIKVCEHWDTVANIVSDPSDAMETVNTIADVVCNMM